MLRKIVLMFGLTSLSLVALAQTDSAPSSYELPGDNVYPEGIAYDAEDNAFFVGSAAEGTIFRGDLETGEVTTFVEGSRDPFTTLGLKVDDQKQLWVAGGSGGQVYVYDLETAEQTRTIETPEAESTFLNDLVVTASGDVYATDSNRPVLFKVSGNAEAAEPWLDFTGTAFEYQQEGVNANGIEVTPDDQYLLVIQMNTGKLFRIEVASKEVSEVDLGGETLANGDGLVLDGQTLYVIVQQPENEVAVVELADDFASGTVTSRTQHESLAAPATGIKVDDRLLIVNTQFDTMGSEEGPALPFTVSNLPVSMLSGEAAD